jgi:hypothetical protein
VSTDPPSHQVAAGLSPTLSSGRGWPLSQPLIRQAGHWGQQRRPLPTPHTPSPRLEQGWVDNGEAVGPRMSGREGRGWRPFRRDAVLPRGCIAGPLGCGMSGRGLRAHTRARAHTHTSTHTGFPASLGPTPLLNPSPPSPPSPSPDADTREFRPRERTASPSQRRRRRRRHRYQGEALPSSSSSPPLKVIYSPL